jgi:elongation factor P
MFSYTELKPGIYIIVNNQPFLVLESEFLRMQQRQPVMKTKLKNLISGALIERSFQPSDELEEAKIEKFQAKFLYQHRAEFQFSELENPKNRFILKSEVIGDLEKFLKQNLEITAIKFHDKIISIKLPIKVDYKVTEAPPAIRGDTAQGGTKVVTIETGAKISTPLFINEGDIIRVNTATGEYVERIKKK